MSAADVRTPRSVDVWGEACVGGVLWCTGGAVLISVLWTARAVLVGSTPLIALFAFLVTLAVGLPLGAVAGAVLGAVTGLVLVAGRSWGLVNRGSTVLAVVAVLVVTVALVQVAGLAVPPLAGTLVLTVVLAAAIVRVSVRALEPEAA